MEDRFILRASRPAGFMGLPEISIPTAPVRTGFLGTITSGYKAGVIGAAVLLLLVLGQGRLSAQQAPAQDWPPDDPAPGQFAQSPQNGYGQQPYAVQPYAQPRYAQPSYGPGQQPGYGQPPYLQQSAQPQYAQPQYPSNQQPGYGQQFGQQQNYPLQGSAQGQPLSPDELQQLVAPIALYPDSLVAEILAASTYPAQAAAADQWLQSQGNAPAEQIAAGADAQSSWDPSVKGLTAFPQVLAMLDRNLQWTTSLGNAYYNQPQDVLQTIQVMRQRAEQAGNLQSTPQADITNNQGYIDIAPANPQVVYVPSYNPWDVYGQPVSPYPGFSLIGALGSFFGSSPVQYGLGIAMQAFMQTPWGWLGWGLDWLGHAILFHHNDYWTHSTSVADWGFPHGGPRAYPGRRDMGRGDYGWSHGANNRGVGNNRGYGQTYASRGNDGYNRGYGQGFTGSQGRYGDARTAEGFNRGFPSRSEAYGRPSLPSQHAYGRFLQPAGRQEEYASRGNGSGYGAGYGAGYGSGYGFGSASRGSQNYGGRSGMNYSGPSRSFVSPETNYQRGNYGERGYGNSQIYGNSQHSGGFHMFGGGHSSEGYKAPRGNSYGGGSSGGGSSRGYKAPKAEHFSGGGHFGGGHSGGHSGGGHSGGGHGHHH